MTMNPTPDHLDDELLSALLDGAGAFPEGGHPDAAAHVGACDVCTGRQAELAAARGALAAGPVEPLDELTRRRLVAAALRAADETPAAVATARRRSGWATRHPAFVGSAAAVLLAVLVGVPFVLGNDGSKGNTTLSAQAPETLRDESALFLGDLGDLGDRDGLRLRLTGGGTDTYASAPMEPGPSPVAGGGSSGTPLPAGSPAGGGLAGSANQRSGSPPAAATSPREETTSAAAKDATASPEADAANSTAGFAREESADRDRVDTETCVAALLRGPARDGRLTRSGVGTYRGRPAIVASFELDGGTVAFVTDRAGCAVLDRFSL
jgi:hypothetical protein